jgi:pilus assembly protein Flp/PilA
MNALVSRMKAFLVSEDGPTATEYAVMLALIIIACLAAVQILGAKVTQVFTDVNAGLP